jgi:hypothetical protein
VKRFRRWLFRRLAILSSICFVAALSVWIRSSCSSDTILWSNDTNWKMGDIYWVDGYLNVGYLSGNIAWGFPPGIHFSKNDYPDIAVWAAPAHGWSGWGGGMVGVQIGHHRRVYRRPTSDRFSVTYLVMPLWIITAVTGTLPAVFAVRHFKKGTQSLTGLCAHCGYDLRATPDRCPECGTPSLTTWNFQCASVSYRTVPPTPSSAEFASNSARNPSR